MSERLIIAAAAIACLVLAVPTMETPWRVSAGGMILLMVCFGLLLDSRRADLRRSSSAVDSSKDSVRHANRPDSSRCSLESESQSASEASMPNAPPWSIRPSHRGTFNPDDGLDSMISPLSLPDDSRGI